MARKYVVGRGEIHFAAFINEDQQHRGFRYIGNTPEFSLNLESENLDHFSSERGLRDKDASPVIEVARSLSIVTDEIKPENLAMFLLGTTAVVADAGGAVVEEAIDNVIPGNTYQLGESAADGVGNMGVTFPGSGGTLFTVTDDAGTPVTFDATDDYLVDPVRGLLTIVEGGAITDGTNLLVSYTVEAKSRQRTTAGAVQVAGALKFVEYNAYGENKVWNIPSVSLSPNGDLNLKAEDWQQIPLSGEILKKGALETIYVDGMPYTPA